MLVDESKYIWQKESVEEVSLTSGSFPFIPARVLRVYQFDSVDYTGEITILESETAEKPLYQGTLPFIPQASIAFNSLVFVLPEESGTAVISVTAETGTLKAVLEPYLNTTEGMDYISNGYNDDSTYSTTGLEGFMFNGGAASTIFISSNHWFGFGTNSEQLKVCRRDGCSTAILRQLIECDSGLQILKIRFEGYTVYKNRVESNRLIFELFLISNNDMFLNVIQTPTSGNNGESSLVCNGTTTGLNLNVGSPDGAMVSFYHLDENGYQWDIRYEMYSQAGGGTQLYLLRLEDTFYAVSEGVLVPLEVTVLNALAFMMYGFEEKPSAELLTPLANPQVYFWQSGTETTPIKTVLKAYPYPQILDTVADMSHITILGIKLITAEYSGNVGVSYSLDLSLIHI